MVGAEPREGAVGVLVISGFLGAGKTTLVNRILSERHGERIAVVVNEFGDVPIDGRLVVSADDEIVELANGCICCTVRGDLTRSLSALLKRRARRLFRSEPFEHILLETSGLASPGPVVQTLLIEPELARLTRPLGVVTLVHAVQGLEQLERHPEVAEQIGYADRLVLNHSDQVPPERLDELEAVLRARNALASVERTSRAEIAIADIFAANPRAPELWSEQEAKGAPHGHTDGVTTFVLESDGPLDLHALKMWLRFLATKRDHELWRSKGLLHCKGEAKAVLVQSVYQHLELGPSEEEAPKRSQLVLIGRKLNRAELERGWQAIGGTG